MPATGQTSPCLWTPLPQSRLGPCDRYKHACCSYDGTVYVLGGRDSGCLGDFWKYSVVLDEWTRLSCTGEAAPEELEQHTMVAHKGFLYVFGGMWDSPFTGRRCPLWVFDTVNQKWVPCQGKTSSPQTQRPSNRKGHSAVVLGSAMLVYGGFMDIKGPVQEFWSLNLYTMAWSPLSGSERGSSGPGPRHNHSAVAYQSDMFLFGGLKGLREQRDFWKWNSTNHTWTCLKPGPPRLTGHAAVTYRDSMLLFGGGESHSSPNNGLWRYSFSSQSWSRVASLPGSDAPGRIHHCCAGLGRSYEADTGSSSPAPDSKPKHFRNRCFPASQPDIEMETFSKGLSSPAPDARSETGSDCLTFDNKAFRKQWSCSDDPLLRQEHGDLLKNLPDALLVLGGRPYSRHSPISIWSVTLTDC
ncbi:leucine-zipper-like transcriptional regulator 1 homolog [Fundulus heteroclitus]|uniref:leucine-zipper-like transcriptional regulator 1 homolog n=1 Tax=Fundulus heteroclitus TaxID=8078 RepID=UPI00165B9BAC|nr:leucine-zipper-like transcriptional regulator 1 homolog [Fundulus heteroclitus]XP_021180054.2 leucine-zipper-like transcriptional regulator 1 homolog [Fundulus heteroclitus]XP_021180055.2 leucine-zipper-like transcriptional regulator 1 homolog [Fundulus heteroclitus]